MNYKNKVIIINLLFFIFSLFLFSRMGGEFLPELDEGYMLLEVARLPSVSLSESLNMSARLEKALLKGVPEIQHTTNVLQHPSGLY